MSWSIRLGSAFGTDVRVHLTFFFLLAWLGTAVWLQTGKAAAIDAIIFVCLLFACVVLHEFGHVLMARRYGIGTRDITLWPIGGIASLERMPEKPSEEIAVALAGPAVNIALAVILIVVFGAPFDLTDVRIYGEDRGSLLGRLATVNVILAVFNLIPAFPMDGGRVLRAALGHAMSYVRATRIAARVGQTFAIFLAFLGLLGNPFLVLIGIFVYLAASGEALSVSMRDTARGHRVRDAMISRFESLGTQSSISDAADLLLKTTQQEFPVVDDQKHLRGFLTRAQLIKTLGARGAATPVLEVMDADIPVQSVRNSMESVVELLKGGSVPAVGIIDEQNRFIGYVTTENVTEMLLLYEAAGTGGAR